MKLLRSALAFSLFAVTSAFAQNASLSASQSNLSPAGGTVQLKATVNYDGMPGAVGWSIELPADWSLVSVTGPNEPAIAPEPGTTGTLEFAYTNVPTHRAEFSVLVKYPAGVTAAAATPKVLVRAEGKLTTLTPAAVEFRAAKG